ncbi:MAG: hypothetical protein Q8L75_14495 [Acidobacteriota bacterium]|nr:hypothetical protein [Acidobacteriota bacterium]
MHLIQILLPTQHRDGRDVGADAFTRVRAELIERFGGVTAYTRSPATGLWKSGTEVERDQVVMVEVVVDVFDRDWWVRYRESLEDRFGQEEVHARVLAIERI